MNNVQNAKKQANAIIQDAIGQRVQELMKTRAFQELKEQAKHHETTGNFVTDQVKFTLDAIKKIGHAIK